MIWFAKTPSWIQGIFPKLTWRIPVSGKKIFLTFDDGPTPGVTDRVLDLLKAKGLKASFFCLGKNAAEHPELIRRIIAEGHVIGNHTWSHPNAWRISNRKFLNDVKKSQDFFTQEFNYTPVLFRPPYGRLTIPLSRKLRDKFEIVLWDVIPGDFDPSLDKEACLENALEHSQEGSVVLLHDSVKCQKKMFWVLENLIDTKLSKGYCFEALEQIPVRVLSPSHKFVGDKSLSN